MNLREITFDVRQLAIESRIQRDLIRTFATEAQVRSVVDLVTDDLVISVRQKVASQPLRREVVEYPADWWQAFRLRWFPQWALVRWPPRLKRVEVRADAVYPGVPVPHIGSPRIVVLDRQDWDCLWGSR